MMGQACKGFKDRRCVLVTRFRCSCGILCAQERSIGDRLQCLLLHDLMRPSCYQVVGADYGKLQTIHRTATPEALSVLLHGSPMCPAFDSMLGYGLWERVSSAISKKETCHCLLLRGRPMRPISREVGCG